MESKIKINRGVAFREKNGVYVFYYDFNYLFFSGTAAQYVSLLLSCLAQDKSLDKIPQPFLDYLKSRKLVVEE